MFADQVAGPWSQEDPNQSLKHLGLRNPAASFERGHLAETSGGSYHLGEEVYEIYETLRTR
jgi:hypothetical protein